MARSGLIILGLFVFLLGCKPDEPERVEEIKLKNDAGSVVNTGLPELDNDFLVSIYEAQELIKIEQDNIELRKQYCNKALLKEQGYFISMGIGRKVHPETGESIPASLAERSALIDAMRWAAYGFTWLKNDYQPSFGKIDVQLKQNYSLLNRANVGDSLFVFVATKAD